MSDDQWSFVNFDDLLRVRDERRQVMRKLLMVMEALMIAGSVGIAL